MTNKFQITYKARNLKDEEMRNYIAMFVEWAMKNYIVCLLYFSTNVKLMQKLCIQLPA